MKNYSFLLLFLFFGSALNAQIGTVNFIDTSVETAGISKIIPFDFNNDGFEDLLTATTGTNGRLGIYNNQANGTFSAFNLIDSFEFCRGMAIGNFNNDGVIDLVAIGKTTNQSVVYLSGSAGTYNNFVLDSNSMILNDVVVADFDQNNLDDIVVIGQHSIDFYRNNGLASFTKETILTTSTSPVVLECLDLAIKDIDNDGDIDIISGETAGLVVYKNNGNAVFTPHYYSIMPEVIVIVHPVDIDNDGDFDLVAKNAFGQVKWFSNDGNGVMTFESILSNVPNCTAINTLDFNNDGLQDLYVSYPNHVSVFANDPMHLFTAETNLHQDSSLIMGEITLANVDNQTGLDYVWSGNNNALAYHINQTALNVHEELTNRLQLYPNPTESLVNLSQLVDKITLYHINGKKIKETENAQTIDFSGLSAGTYTLLIEYQGKSSSHKIIKK